MKTPGKAESPLGVTLANINVRIHCLFSSSEDGTGHSKRAARGKWSHQMFNPFFMRRVYV